jgi:transcriptional/translational regulatory protein YebC/TACO1
LEAGADDLQTTDEEFIVLTDPKEFTAVRDALKEAGFNFTSADLAMIPQNTIEVPEDKAETFQNMLDALDDNDDVTDVYTSASWPEDAE